MASSKPSIASLTQSATDLLTAATPLSNFLEGSTAGAFVNLIVQQTNLILGYISAAEDARNLDTATGQDLDNLARTLGGLVRQAPLAAGAASTAAQLLVTNTSAQTLSFPINTLVWAPTNPNLTFVTNNTVSIPAGSSSTVFIQASQIGSNYNVAAGTLTSHNSNSAFQIVNILPVQGGNTTETDDQFRYRISQILQAAVLGGQSSATGVMNALLNIPGIIDVILRPEALGPGTLDAIIVPAIGYLPDDDFLSSCTEEMARVAAAGISVRALAPTYVNITTEVIINASGINATLTPSSTLRTQIQNIVNNYINSRTVQVDAVAGVNNPYNISTSTSNSMINYLDILTLVTNSALANLNNQVQGVYLSFSIGSSDAAIQGDLYAQSGECFTSSSVLVTVNYNTSS